MQSKPKPATATAAKPVLIKPATTMSKRTNSIPTQPTITSSTKNAFTAAIISTTSATLTVFASPHDHIHSQLRQSICFLKGLLVQ